jgi:hypothetical protein
MHFFTEIDNLKNQNTSGNGLTYGPSGSSGGKDLFRVTSTHKTDGDAKAIAICKGIILVQEQTGNSNLVNIVLKPFEQPPFEFPKIKYFIYRGINKSSLVSGSLVAGSQNALSSTNSNLTQSIWIDYRGFNGSTAEPPIALLGLGMDTANSPYKDSDSIDGIFNQINANHQLPVVQAGWHIGDFGADHVGFEIMFESLGFEPTLEIARKAENVIEVNTLPGSPTQAAFFEHWHDKEEILNYLDPCAFFGSFYAHDLKVKNSNGSESLKKGETIYNDILINFINKNKCYIDIRNEFNFSLNYFKNYGASATNNTTNVSLKKGTSISVNLNYYDNKWPILILDYTGFSGSVTTHQTLGIKLPCNSGSNNDDNPRPMIYLDKAYVPDTKFPDEFLLKDKFLPLNVSNHYTDEFVIGLPCKNSELLSCYSRIKFCKRNNSSSLPSLVNTQIRRTNYLDCIFPISLDYDYSISSFVTKIFNESIYIDMHNSENFDAAFLIAISKDDASVILMAAPYQFNDNEDNSLECSFSAQDEFKSIQIKENYLTRLINKNCNTLWNNSNQLIGLNFDHNDWNSIINIAQNSSNFIQKFPKYVSVVNKQSVTINNVSFFSYDIKIIGYKLDSNNIIVSSFSSNINVYK